MSMTIPRNGTTYDVSPTITIQLSVELPSGAVVRVVRNGAAVGAATLQGDLTYTFTDTDVPFGTQEYTCVMEIGTQRLPGANSYSIVVLPPNEFFTSVLYGALIKDELQASSYKFLAGYLLDAIADSLVATSPVMSNGSLQVTVSFATAAVDDSHIVMGGMRMGDGTLQTVISFLSYTSPENAIGSTSFAIVSGTLL